MTTQVLIRYPSGDIESVSARATDKPDEWELRSHTFLMPLGPGDVVRVDKDMEVVDVVHLDPQFIHHVDLHLPADYTAGPLSSDHPAQRIAEQLADEWTRDTTVTLLTTFSMVVSCTSDRWFQEKVASNKYVAGTTMTRTPDVRYVPVESKPVL